MPIYEVEGPNGKIYEIEGPEGATIEQLTEFINTQSAPEPDNSLQQWTGVATRALLPYGLAAAAGGAAGAPFGGVGAAPGAAGGVLALGLGDIGTGVYNLAATPFGAPRATLPSETIRQMYEAAGGPGTRQPQTTPQRIFSAGLEAATGAGGTATALNRLAPLAREGTLGRNVMTEMGRGVRAQTVGGAGSGGLTQAAIEGGETDPLKLFLVSLAGGVGGTLAGGRTPRPTITGQDIRDRARAFYQQAEREGVLIRPNVADDLADRLENTLLQQGAAIAQQYRTQIMREIRNLRNRPYNDLSFEELETIRSDLGLIGRDPQTGKVVANTPGEQANRLAGIVQDELDEFFTNLDVTQVSAGDPQRAVGLVTQARQEYTNARKGEILEQVLSRTELSRGSRPKIDVLQKRLEPIVADERLMRKFSPAEQDVIRSLQSGNVTERTLSLLGQLAPSLDTMPGIAKLTAYAVPSTIAASTVDPTYAGIVGTVGGAALASRAMANRMALRRASDVAENVLTGRPPPSAVQQAGRAAGRAAAYAPPVVLGAQNAFLTDAYGRSYDAQGNRLR
jgi:hypothetical protein